jgi:hypothetical protein
LCRQLRYLDGLGRNDIQLEPGYRPELHHLRQPNGYTFIYNDLYRDRHHGWLQRCCHDYRYGYAYAGGKRLGRRRHLRRWRYDIDGHRRQRLFLEPGYRPELHYLRQPGCIPISHNHLHSYGHYGRLFRHCDEDCNC